MRTMFDRVRAARGGLPAIDLAAARDYVIGATFVATMLFLGCSLWQVGV